MRRQFVRILLLCNLFCLPSNVVSDATEKFSAKLLKTLFDDPDKTENSVLSGVSLYDALAIVHQGAEGNTLAEITKVLNADAAATKSKYSALVQDLKKDRSNAGSEVEFANKLYVNKSFKVKPAFEKTAREDFLSDIEEADFANAQEVANKINSWVSEETHQKIKDLVSKDSISANLVMMILNAVYFSGNWTNKFETYTTEDKDFTKLGGTKASVPTMHMSKTLKAAHVPEIAATYVILPFTDQQFSMIIVVPDEVDGIGNVVNKIETSGLSIITSQNINNYVELALPKFKFGARHSLVPTLEAMGLTDLFSNSANLNGIADVGLRVSDVVQRAEIEVTETGATAAAATGISIVLTSAIIPPDDKLVVKADHPFLFFLYDNVNSVPLFSGWVGSP